VKKFTAADTSA